MVGEKANSTVDFKTISFEKFIVWEIAARKLDFSRKPSIYVNMLGVSTLHFAVFVICTLFKKIYFMSWTGSEFMNSSEWSTPF